MKKVIAVALAVAMASSLAACSVSTSTTTTSTADSTAAESSAAAPAASGNTVKLYNGKIEIKEAVDAAAAAYEKATGNHVEVESIGGGVDLQANLKQYYQAGNMPDIFVGEGWADFSNWDGMMADLGGEAWTKDTEAEFVDPNGMTVGFPYTTEAIGLAYNADVLEKAGIDPASLTTVAAYEEAFAKLDGMKDELGLTSVTGYCAEASALYWSSAQHVFGQYIDAGLARTDTTYIDMLNGDEHKLDVDRFTNFAKFVDMLAKYSDPALVISGTYDQQVMGFAEGKYAFLTQGSWIGASMTNQYKEQYDAAGNFKCGFAPYAFEDGIDTILTNSPSWWAVYKDGNVEGAKAFLQWLSEDGQEYMVTMGGCNSPFASCTYVANDPFAQAVADYTAAGKTSSWHWLDQPSNLAQDYTGVVFQDFAAGKLDVDKFVTTMQQVITACFAA